jgi:predicted RNase H-like HicB family nuclease
MKFVTTLDRDKDGAWIVKRPAIPGCISQGENREEAMANIADTITECLEVRREQGMQKEFFEG